MVTGVNLAPYNNLTRAMYSWFAVLIFIGFTGYIEFSRWVDIDISLLKAGDGNNFK